ncbi:MAG: hypothetical protein B7Y39_10970, partial [Bdellovibrio sp. 28-41-41]
LILSGCTQGVSSGSLSRKFAGVQEAKVLSPTQVRLSWLRSPEDIDYTVYMAGSAAPLKTLTFESYTVENLEANSVYKFKVVARNAEGTIGDDKEISVTTAPRFQGLTKVTKDENGNFVLSWDYPHEIKSFHVFYLPEYAPSELNTNAWTKINAQTTQNTHTVTDWNGASTYYFTVHAEYNSGEMERPNVFQSLQANPSFPADAIEINIPTLTIGSLPVISVTPHREGVLNDYPLANYSSQLYQGDSPISDPQSGISNLVVLPNANLSLGIVDNLNVRITYNGGGINQTLIKRNRPDGTPFSTVLKNQSNILETPPVDATLGGPGFMGKVVATGDFNCDGADDLAVGMPETSIANLGQKEAFAGVVYIYYSRTSGGKTQLYTPAQGAPQPAVSPVIRGVDPQIIAIADLPVKSRFGSSLSAGNINMDFAGSPLRECDDLVVGAPGMQHAWSPTGVYTDAGGGSAFLFFGSSEGINAPTSLTSIAENQGTCLGNYVGDVCSPVRIWPKKENYYNSDIARSAAILSTYWGFGHSVAVVGDMNGDGYSEIAVGSPYSDYEGRTDDATSVSSTTLRNAGSVHLYFGSKRGLGFAQIKKVTNATSTYPLDCTSSSQKGCVKAIKIFSPLPQDGQLFGYSLAGNVDVDGSAGPQGNLFKSSQISSKCTSSFPNVCFSASDMIVGAPGGGLSKPSGIDPFKTYSTSVFPRFVAPMQFSNTLDLDWPANSASLKWNSGDFSYGTVATNGFSAATAGKGLAFVFFGMTDQDVQIDGGTGDRDVSNYYSCSNRYDESLIGAYAGGAPNELHFSCFTNGKNVRYIHIRDTETSGLGRSVVLLGNRSAQLYGTVDGVNYTWNKMNKLDETYSSASSPFNAYAGFNEDPKDANGDFFGDVFVGAPYSSTVSPTYSNTGAVLGFFGNPGRLFGTDSLKAKFIASSGDVATSGYFQNSSPLCRNFDIVDNTGNSGGFDDQILCRPVLIKPNSLTAGGMLAHDRSALSKGDVDGDGLQDLIVGAPFDSSTGGTDSGAVFVFTSEPNRGIGTSNYKVSNVRAGTAGTRFGTAVAAGRFEDPNNTFNSIGKPFVSVVAGAPNDYSGTGSSQKPGGGAVHLYKTNYASFASTSTPTESVKETLTSFQDLKYQSAKIVGDINNDGYDDAVAHTFYFNTQGERVYEAAVYFGARIGLISPEFCKNNMARIFESGGSEAECLPKVTRISSVKTKDNIKLPQKVAAPNGVITGWAFFAAGIGDMNRDGFDDVLFMNPFQKTTGKGNIVIYFGGSVGLNAVNSPSYTPVSVGDPQIVTAGWGYNTDQYYYISENSAFDLNLVNFGDFNGDGFSDVVLSDYYSWGPSFESDRVWNCQSKPDDDYCPKASVQNYGRVFIIYGSSKGLQTPRLTNGLAADLFPFNPDAGTYAKGTAFYDPYEPLRDSYPNLGSERFNEQDGISGAYACDAVSCKPTVIWNPLNIFDYTKKGTVEGTYFENFPEASAYMNISFGKSLAVGKITAGTSDDSSFDTLIVGAPDFIDLACSASVTTSQSRSGRVFLFYGSAKGIRAFNRREYYTPDPSVGVSAGCWASPSNSENSVVDETNVNTVQAGNDLKLHTRSLVADTPKRVIALQPPIPNNRLPSSFNGLGRRFGDKVQVIGDANGDGVEDLIVSNRHTTVSDAAGQIRDYGLGVFYGQAWVYYGGLCSSDNDKETWASNDDPLAPKLALAGTEAEFLGGLNGVPTKTLSSVCFKNSMTKKFLPHTFTALGGSVSDGDSFFSALSSGRLGKGNFNFDGIDNYADVIVGTKNSADSVSNTDSLGDGIVFFGSDLGLITDELAQTFMSQKSGSTLLKPRYRPYRIKPIFKFSDARFFSGSVSTGDVNGDSAMDMMIPSDSYAGSEQNKGVSLGAFMLFY